MPGSKASATPAGKLRLAAPPAYGSIRTPSAA